MIDTIEFDWKSFGEAMGLDEDQLANVTQDGPDFTISEAVELILRSVFFFFQEATIHTK